MSPLILVTTFLMLMSILTSSEIGRFLSRSYEGHLYKNYLAAETETQHEREEAIFHQHASQEYQKSDETRETSSRTSPSKRRKSISLGFNLSRPPNNARLDFYDLFFKKERKGVPPHLTRHEIAAALLRSLYSHCSFYTPQLEYRLLDALAEHKETMESFTHPDDLATLTLNDTHLQKALYSMLKGAPTLKENPYPSLLNYITFDQQGLGNRKKINFLFASPELLSLLFPNPETLTQALEIRSALWNQMLSEEERRKELYTDECLNRTAITSHLITHLKTLLGDSSEILPLFDLTVGHPGTILFIPNPETGMIKREKITTHS